MSKKPSVLLPAHIRPSLYRITMHPDLEKFAFSGEESIYITLDKAVNEITLHSVDVRISSATFIQNKKTLDAKIVYNPESETATFKFPKKIISGEGELFITFSGVLAEGLKGFYRSKYEVDGQVLHMATTQFEATDARRAFPCFDEPAHKAVFEVSLIVPKHLTAISNTLEMHAVPHSSSHKIVTFSPSPKMSTYLLAFIVGEFEYLEGKTKNGVKIRVFTTRGKKGHAKFALDVAIRALDFYESYFAIPYPLPVLDLIAIPDFASAAMENWGAITYRETALLVDPLHSSAANKQWVAVVIAHEIAHQWFGNLVTMHWWDDLWLNEGFASYMEYVCLDALFPEWYMWDQYVADRFAIALRIDSLQTTHPIEMAVNNPDEINEAFDVPIGYGKSNAVIRMLASFLGADKFRDGLRYYLKKHAYGNARTKDLWLAFEKISKQPVEKIMKHWTQKGGYPLITLVEQDHSIKLSQKRFFSSEPVRRSSKDRAVWQVPVEIKNDKGVSKKILLGKKSQIVPWKKSAWVKVNPGETGYYRTRYPKNMIERIKPEIANLQLPVRDRFGIIRDAFALSQAGEFSTVAALELAKEYKNETQLPVWQELAANVFEVGELFAGEPWFNQYKLYGGDLFSEIFKRLGWERGKHEPYTDGLLRSLVLSHLGYYKDQSVIAHAQSLFKRAMAGVPVSPDVRGVVYDVVAANGGIREFKALVDMYRQSGAHPEEKERIGRALGNFSDPVILQKVLDFLLGKDVRAQDTPFIFAHAASHFNGRGLAWEFFTNNWTVISKKYATGGHLLGRFVTPFSKFSEYKNLKEVKQFFRQHRVPAIDRTVQQTIERIEANVAWVKREKSAVRKWLEGKSGE
jgi:puromycin-sensitive aminopeptidase